MNTPRPMLTISAGPNVLGSRWGSDAERPEGQRHALAAYTACHAGLASLCIHGEATVMYLDAVDKGTPMCGPCIAAATRLGMNPRADRRSVERIPEWRKRSLAKDFTRMTGAA